MSNPNPNPFMAFVGNMASPLQGNGRRPPQDEQEDPPPPGDNPPPPASNPSDPPAPDEQEEEDLRGGAGEHEEEVTDDQTGNDGDKDTNPFASSFDRNPAESPAKLKKDLNDTEEHLESSMRSQRRAQKEWEELSSQGDAADQDVPESCRKDLDRSCDKRV